MVKPTNRSSFTSTVWGGAGKGRHTTNAAMWGGPNVNIKEGSKVQFRDGDTVWDVMRVFNDGALHLTSVAGGRKMTRKVAPSSQSWANLRMVDGRRFASNDTEPKPKQGGGPGKTLEVGNVVVLEGSKVKWTVESILRDGAVRLYTMQGEKISYATVGPKSRYWELMLQVSA